MSLPIALAKQENSKPNNLVYIYGEDGNLKFILAGDLVGFTSTTVSITPPSSNLVHVYDKDQNFKYVL